MARKKQQTRPSPDDGLVPEQFPELNRQFYGANLQPYDYLMTRYRSIFLSSQTPGVLPCAYDAELSIGALHGTWPTPEVWDADAMRDYISTESIVLLHHASEALFRLYFAHADSPDCPWLGVARLRQPSQFKDRVSRFIRDLGKEETASSVMGIIIGHSKPPEGNLAEQWHDIKDGLMSLMGHLSKRLLDEAPLYNAAKHGLSLVPGAAAMSFGPPDEEHLVSASGPSITHLTVRDGSNGRRWAQETVWVNATQTLSVAALAIYQIGNLWQVAEHRYTGSEFNQAKMKYPRKDIVSAVLHPKEEYGDKGYKISVPSMTTELLYFEKPTQR